ncbi:MAG: PepSY-like domain-containing protein [Flavisolibacter sp.]
MKKTTGLAFFLLIFSLIASAQVRRIPAEVTTAFEIQYPQAGQVSYKDQLKGVTVHFVQDSIKMIAKYSNDGTWKETEKATRYEQLPSEVHDGFKKSKYADGEWKISEAAILILPGETERYRVKVEKNELQKKSLLFEKGGRLIKESITL